MESSGEEERERGSSCGKDGSMEEPGLESEDLEAQITTINQIESDELLAHSLQDEIDRELQTLDGFDKDMSVRTIVQFYFCTMLSLF
jgi:hypothetical protein